MTATPEDLAVNRAAEVILSAMCGGLGRAAHRVAYDAAVSLNALGLLRPSLTPACPDCGIPHADVSQLGQRRWTAHVPQCTCPRQEDPR